MSEKIEIIKLDDITPYLDKIDRKDAEPWLWEEVSENGDEIFFIRVSDAIVGTAYIGDEAKAFVYVYIFPEYRNRGYGEAAAIAAEQMIKTTPLLRILTAYNDHSEAAKRLAEKHGYLKKYSSALMRYAGEPFPEPELPVRKYRDEDFEEAALLSAEAFHVMRLSTGCFPDSVVRQPSEEERRYWAEHADDGYVYLSGSEIVGHARIEGPELDVVSIKIPHQGKGLGRKFVKYLTNRIIEKGEGEPVLWCVVGNDKARALYDSLGYEEVCRNDFAVKKLGK
jgi:mycothiol synthase